MHIFLLTSSLNHQQWNSVLSPDVKDNTMLITTDMSIQWTCLYNGHVYTMDMSIQWACLYNGHVYTMDMSIQWTCLYNGHVYTFD